SGTSALHMSLIELGVSRDDLVVVPTLTFIAAVNPVMYVGAEPIFMDCDDSLCMDADKLLLFCEKECNYTDGRLVYKKNNKQVKAIIVVHVFGNMANMEKLLEVSKKYDIKIIEDATEALGTYYIDGPLKDKYAGTIGELGAYSFNGNKIITTGGGGAVTSNNKQRAEHIKYLSTQAKNDAHFYVHNEIGFNYRMTNVQAALGVAQMECLETFIERKNKNYDLYCELLNGEKSYCMLPFSNGIRSNKWFYSLVVNIDITNKDIRDIIKELEDEGVQSRPIWGLIHEQLPYRRFEAYKIEKAKYYSERIINLPSSTNITREEIITVCDKIKKILP
ncbi:MAG: DegT/DnrJ/EryC1/StrS family aminotransferase, partial [Oscillospiraceae bacterium]